MMENETENVTIENVEPTVNDLAFKLDTGIPDIEPEAETGPEDEPRAEPEDEPGPGAKPGPEDEPRAEPQVRGKLPYASSKSPITDKNYRLDKRTNWLYNIKTLKYFDVKTGMDSEKDYVPEAEPANITIPEEIILSKVYIAPKKVEHKIQCNRLS